MDLGEIVAALKAHVATGKEALEATVSKLRSDVPEVHQTIFNAGYARSETFKERAETAEGKVGALEREKTELEGKVTALQEAKPDIAKIHADHQTATREIKEQHQAALEAKDHRIRELILSGAQSTLKSKMIEKGIRPLFAEARAAKKMERVKVDLEKADYQVMQNGKEIPVDHEDPLTVLADEAFNEADPDEKTAKVPGGGPNLRDRTAGGGTPTGDEKYRKIAEDTKREFEGKEDPTRAKHKRLGLVT